MVDQGTRMFPSPPLFSSNSSYVRGMAAARHCARAVALLTATRSVQQVAARHTQRERSIPSLRPIPIIALVIPLRWRSQK